MNGMYKDHSYNRISDLNCIHIINIALTNIFQDLNVKFDYFCCIFPSHFNTVHIDFFSLSINHFFHSNLEIQCQIKNKINF